MEHPEARDALDLDGVVRKTHYRAIFLSDIHLGTRGCQAQRLVTFLKAHSCDVIYLVGDIVDGWRLRSGFYWPRQHNNEDDEGTFRILDYSQQEAEILPMPGRGERERATG